MNGPRHNRFEIEDIIHRRNYTFVFDEQENKVSLYDTSRGSGNVLMEDELINPDIADAREYYNWLYNKSLIPCDELVVFIGYVDENFQPIEPP